MFAIRHEVYADAVAVETLLDRCFGQHRHAKVSYRYRDGVPPLIELCFVAEDESGHLVGAIRYWPLCLSAQPALLLGPLAIDPERQGRGIGRALVFHSLETAAAAGHRLVFLVGDPAYYARFGFALAPGQIIMPDEQQSRLNYRILDPTMRLPRRGTLRPLSQEPPCSGQRRAGTEAHSAQIKLPEVEAPQVKAIASAPCIH